MGRGDGREEHISVKISDFVNGILYYHLLLI